MLTKALTCLFLLLSLLQFLEAASNFGTHAHSQHKLRFAPLIEECTMTNCSYLPYTPAALILTHNLLTKPSIQSSVPAVRLLMGLTCRQTRQCHPKLRTQAFEKALKGAYLIKQRK